MIAGGTGITPMLQIVKAVLDNPRDKSELWLLFANREVDDILVRDYLEEYFKRYPGRLHLWYNSLTPIRAILTLIHAILTRIYAILTSRYTLEQPPGHWTENSFSDGIGRSEGFVSASMMADALPPPGNDTVVLCCGPPPMIDYACKPGLTEVVYFESYCSLELPVPCLALPCVAPHSPLHLNPPRSVTTRSGSSSFNSRNQGKTRISRSAKREIRGSTPTTATIMWRVRSQHVYELLMSPTLSVTTGTCTRHVRRGPHAHDTQ